MQGKQSSSLYLALIEFLTRGFTTDVCGDSALDNITTADAGRRFHKAISCRTENPSVEVEDIRPKSVLWKSKNAAI